MLWSSGEETAIAALVASPAVAITGVHGVAGVGDRGVRGDTSGGTGIGTVFCEASWACCCWGNWRSMVNSESFQLFPAAAGSLGVKVLLLGEDPDSFAQDHRQVCKALHAG
jgi:hypothetical protein